jgi:hypothetical protein
MRLKILMKSSPDGFGRDADGALIRTLPCAAMCFESVFSQDSCHIRYIEMAERPDLSRDVLVRRGLRFAHLRLMAALRETAQLSAAAPQVAMPSPPPSACWRSWSARRARRLTCAIRAASR